MMVARKLRTNAGGLVSLDEAMNSGRLLVEAYSAAQSEASALEALMARDYIISTGVSLGMYAAEESLEIVTTQEFTAVSVREAAAGDPAGYLGILSSEEFADAALVAEELEVIGPFTAGGSAFLAEISTRHAPELPEDPTLLAPAYLTAQQNHGTAVLMRTVELLRSHSEIEDLREQYYTTIDSLRALQPEEEPTR
jgi:hypothetical protein